VLYTTSVFLSRTAAEAHFAIFFNTAIILNSFAARREGATHLAHAPDVTAQLGLLGQQRIARNDIRRFR